ncbi:hypothetical protein NLS1_37580 [Nocardioides sp. LS1]|nr:hypothetical protein NLS1_37580 [Nocardioides sp. LS1]
MGVGTTTYAHQVQPDSDDDAWRAIVENYGDRPEIERETAPVEEPAAAWSSYDDEDEEPAPDARQDEDRFVPPPPPPLPRTTPDRVAAWLGVFASPAVLLVAMVFGLHLPGFISFLLVGAFVGGFLYLVAQMPRGPRDPWDDGSRL